MAKVIIDPGHGPGSRNKGPTGYYEYQGMWKLSNYLKKALTRCGIQADLTRKENEVPSIPARGKKAKGYDLFISEHSNAADGRARGCEVYYSVNQPKNKKYAADLSKAMSELMGNRDRGPKKRSLRNNPNADFDGVIRNSVSVGCPVALLSEAGFHDNKTDEAWLKKDSNLEALAEVQATCICNILGVKYTKKGEIGVGAVLRHKIEKGDNYWDIGKEYGVSHKDLEKWNGWPASDLPVGEYMWLVDPAKHGFVGGTIEEIEDLEKRVKALEGIVKNVSKALK